MFSMSETMTSMQQTGCCCGDGVCVLGESCSTCQVDCGVCGMDQRTSEETPTISSSALSFGPVAVGTSSDESFVIANTGSGTVSGSATVDTPFSIVSGGSYALSPGESQSVTVKR